MISLKTTKRALFWVISWTSPARRKCRLLVSFPTFTHPQKTGTTGLFLIIFLIFLNFLQQIVNFWSKFIKLIKIFKVYTKTYEEVKGAELVCLARRSAKEELEDSNFLNFFVFNNLAIFSNLFLKKL